LKTGLKITLIFFSERYKGWQEICSKDLVILLPNVANECIKKSPIDFKKTDTAVSTLEI